MIDIFAEIVASLKNRESVVLSTIIASSGSTPLPPGSSMLLKENGNSVLGTIGGGAVEANAVREAKEFFAGTSGSVVKQFELSDDGSEGGMICGGTIDVLIERIGPDDLPLFAQLIDLRDESGDCTLIRGIDPATALVRRVLATGTTVESVQKSGLADLFKSHGVSSEKLLPALQRTHREESVARISGLPGELIIQPIVGTQPLIIVGGGHIGRALSKIAAFSGFAVTVIDEREEFAQRSRFPEAEQAFSKNWNAALEELKMPSTASIVIVTSGHKSDAEVLRQAVATHARYVGMIGSKKKVIATFAQLRKDGIPLSALQRVHAPIGLDIGAVTAEEIAVSILAELVCVRRGFQNLSAPLSSQMKSWFDHPEA